jgi:hypothetical protein
MENEFFYKILYKPLMLIIVISLWPFLTYIVPPSVVSYLNFFYLIQVILVFNYLRLFKTYLRFKKFRTYAEAKSYFLNLNRAKRLELKTNKISIKRAKEESQLR